MSIIEEIYLLINNYRLLTSDSEEKFFKRCLLNNPEYKIKVAHIDKYNNLIHCTLQHKKFPKITKTIFYVE